MQPDTVITHSRISDHITIEDKQYSVYTTLGLTNKDDFYVQIEFIDLDQNSLVEVISLYKIPKALTFSSDLAKKEGYNISHIVVEKMQTNNQYEMTWECLSDEPGLPLII
jgi:hypothetical protein